MTLGAAATAAPFINRHRYRLFARQPTSYAKRTVDLVTSTTVLDMLSPFKIGRSTWMQRPSDFTAADIQRFRDSGISVFHIATGVGGVDAYTNVLRFLGLWNGFLAHHHGSLMRIDSALGTRFSSPIRIVARCGQVIRTATASGNGSTSKASIIPGGCSI